MNETNAVPGNDEEKNFQHRLVRYIVGVVIAIAGTLLCVYVMPTSLATYHWGVLSAAFVLAEAYSVYLFLNYADTSDQDRLRHYLKSYLVSVAIVFVAPLMLPNELMSFEPIARGLGVLPLLAIFVAIASTHIWSLLDSSITVIRK